MNQLDDKLRMKVALLNNQFPVGTSIIVERDIEYTVFIRTQLGKSYLAKFRNRYQCLAGLELLLNYIVEDKIIKAQTQGVQNG
jgi:hypothetical protein